MAIAGTERFYHNFVSFVIRNSPVMNHKYSVIASVMLSAMIILVACNESSNSKENTMSETTQASAIDTTRENNIASIKQFFELLHEKNAIEWGNLWDENGFIYIPYPVANFPDTIRTRKTILEGFEKLLAGFKSFDYNIKSIYPSLDPNVIVIEYTVEAVLQKSNATYHGINIAVFKFQNGKIAAYHDYFNPEKFKMVVEAISR